MEFKDYYEVLGVSPDADDKAIKAAYRRLARKYHPDVSKEANAEEKFKTANEAHEVLGDKTRRAEYDQLRASGYRPGDDYQPPHWQERGYSAGGNEQFGDSGFSDFFESLFGRGGHARRGGPGGFQGVPETRAHLDVDLETAHAGAKQRVQINGKTLEITIPAGIGPGQSIRLKGQGNGGGDLLIEIGYRPHPLYELEGRNVIVRRKIQPWDAALGTSIEVPTLAGTVNLTVPPGTDSGQRLRLRGRGMPGKPAGDQFVVLEVQVPKPVQETQKDAYRELAKAFGHSVPDVEKS